MAFLCVVPFVLAPGAQPLVGRGVIWRRVADLSQHADDVAKYHEGRPVVRVHVLFKPVSVLLRRRARLPPGPATEWPGATFQCESSYTLDVCAGRRTLALVRLV